MLTINEVKEELGIDSSDNDSKITRYISLADTYLQGAIGTDYDPDDERAKQLALFVIEDLYDRNSYTVKENATIAKLKNDFLMQLQCEGRDDTE